MGSQQTRGVDIEGSSVQGGTLDAASACCSLCPASANQYEAEAVGSTAIPVICRLVGRSKARAVEDRLH